MNSGSFVIPFLVLRMCLLEEAEVEEEEVAWRAARLCTRVCACVSCVVCCVRVRERKRRETECASIV